MKCVNLYKPACIFTGNLSKTKTMHPGIFLGQLLRGEKLNYKSVAKEMSKPPVPEVQWASKFAVFVRFTFPSKVSNHAHIWYVT